MNRFAELLDRLVLTPSRNGKLTLLIDYFRSVEDPDRGLALAAITGDLKIAAVKPAMLRALVTERMDPVLFGYSYDYVGDLAETVSLVWPPTPSAHPEPRADAGRGRGKAAGGQPLRRAEGAGRPARQRRHRRRALPSSSWSPAACASASRRGWPSRRWPISARSTSPRSRSSGTACRRPTPALFAWLEGRADKPEKTAMALFRPVMLSNPVGDGDLEKLEPADYAAEWKWDGIRVQAVAEGGVRRLYSRTGDDISGAFPDLAGAMDFSGTLDGELLVGTPAATGTFSDLQQRLNRKTVDAQDACSTIPPSCAATTCCRTATRICAALPFRERRDRLEAFVKTLDPNRFDLSPFVAFTDWHDLEDLRSAPPHPIIEGVMLKRWDSPYLAGRPKGPWFKWKRDPHTVDAVLMYAQRGHGKRSSFYSDYTFGVWSGPEGEEQLVPVGKAYFGFTDEELKQIDKYVRDNTVERFGPVRSVRADRDNGLVLEVAFEGLAPLHPPQIRRRHALSAHLAAALGQAGGRGRPHRDAEGAARPVTYSATDTRMV